MGWTDMYVLWQVCRHWPIAYFLLITGPEGTCYLLLDLDIYPFFYPYRFNKKSLAWIFWGKISPWLHLQLHLACWSKRLSSETSLKEIKVLLGHSILVPRHLECETSVQVTMGWVYINLQVPHNLYYRFLMCTLLFWLCALSGCCIGIYSCYLGYCLSFLLARMLCLYGGYKYVLILQYARSIYRRMSTASIWYILS